MKRPLPGIPLSAALLCLGLSGCGDEGGGEGDSADTFGDFDPAAGFVGCESALVFEDALAVTSTSGALTLRFVSAQPAPPDVGDNLWQLELLDANGVAVSGASVQIEPFMPGHGHGTFPRFADATEVDGVYDVASFNLFMPGYWEHRVVIRTADDQVDSALLDFCIQG